MSEELETDLPDTSDPKIVRKKIKSAKERDEFAIEGLRAMMSSEQGRAWLYKVLESTSVGVNPYNSDPIKMAFACGEMNVGQQIMSDMQTCSFELYMLMMKENSK